jgi:hypothetical protein
VFNLGPGEVVVLSLLGILFLGPTSVPDLAARARASGSGRIPGRWSWSDWLLVGAAVASAAIALRLSVVWR